MRFFDQVFDVSAEFINAIHQRPLASCHNSKKWVVTTLAHTQRPLRRQQLPSLLYMLLLQQKAPLGKVNVCQEVGRRGGVVTSCSAPETGEPVGRASCGFFAVPKFFPGFWGPRGVLPRCTLGSVSRCAASALENMVSFSSFGTFLGGSFSVPQSCSKSSYLDDFFLFLGPLTAQTAKPQTCCRFGAFI
jgi:hypothetical protein